MKMARVLPRKVFAICGEVNRGYTSYFSDKRDRGIGFPGTDSG